eukprot:Filipodium_phascolosomae@DN1536_c0_g1_i1.p2
MDTSRRCICAICGSNGTLGRELMSQLLRSGSQTPIISFSRHHPNWSDNRIIALSYSDVGKEFPFQAHAAYCVSGTKPKVQIPMAQMSNCNMDIVLRFAESCMRSSVEHLSVVSSCNASVNHMDPWLGCKGHMEEQLKQMGFPRLSIFRPYQLTVKETEFSFLETMWQHLIEGLLRPNIKYESLTYQNLAMAMRLNADVTESTSKTEILGYKEIMEVLGLYRTIRAYPKKQRFNFKNK